eukprot:jgi/Chlat1/5648/Chrsp369S05389
MAQAAVLSRGGWRTAVGLGSSPSPSPSSSFWSKRAPVAGSASAASSSLRSLVALPSAAAGLSLRSAKRRRQRCFRSHSESGASVCCAVAAGTSADTSFDASTSTSTAETTSEACAIVQELLQAIEGTDRGASASPEQKDHIDGLINQLIAIGTPNPLTNPLLFADWEVVYTSAPTAAGGSFRTGLGRAIFQTKDMQQSVWEPDGVGNRVQFNLFGVLPGEVSLDGKLEVVDEDTVRVNFERPIFELLGKKFRFGSDSSVVLSVKYLDELVRIGRGGRGSLFVFRRR